MEHDGTMFGYFLEQWTVCCRFPDSQNKVHLLQLWLQLNKLLRVREPCFIASTVPGEHHRSTWHPFTSKDTMFHYIHRGWCLCWAYVITTCRIFRIGDCLTESCRFFIIFSCNQGKDGQERQKFGQLPCPSPCHYSIFPGALKPPFPAWTQMTTQCQDMPVQHFKTSTCHKSMSQNSASSPSLQS